MITFLLSEIPLKWLISTGENSDCLFPGPVWGDMGPTRKKCDPTWSQPLMEAFITKNLKLFHPDAIAKLIICHQVLKSVLNLKHRITRYSQFYSATKVCHHIYTLYYIVWNPQVTEKSTTGGAVTNQMNKFNNHILICL